MTDWVGNFARRVENSARERAKTYSWRLYEAGKPIFHVARGGKASANIFIFGCQRSGTTHLERLFRGDPRSSVFGEFSDLSISPDRTYWRPLPEIAARLDACRGTYSVSRSLLFSHRAEEALEALPRSIAVWVFRDAARVVQSMIMKWGTDFRSVSERVESDGDGRWELRPLWDEIEADVRCMSVGGIGSDQWTRDLYALYWLRRNSLFFDRSLDSHPRVVPLDYGDLVADPRREVRHILARGGLAPVLVEFPQRTVKTRRSALPQVNRFSPPIEAACSQLHARLQNAVEQSR